MSKRAKLADADEEQIFKSRTDIIECEYCHMEFELSDRWAHFASHQVGMQQIRMNLEQRMNPESARLPWYMHSIYQDRSVNQSRYEVMNFSEISNKSVSLAFEKRIKKPFPTHFWLDYKNEGKSSDVVKKYFALNPLVVDYTLNDKNGTKAGQVSKTDPTYFHCAYCNHFFPKRPRFFNNAMAILVHVLGEHSENKEVYDAALEDIKAIQDATGITTYLETVPNYNPLFSHDIIFDPYYGNEIICSTRPRIYSSYCLLCLKDCPTHSYSEFNNKHVKNHKVKLETCSSKFFCISATRYGHSKAIPVKHYGFPTALIFNETNREYSWACSVCKATFASSDSFQLCLYIAYHYGLFSPDCIDTIYNVMNISSSPVPAIRKYFVALFKKVYDQRIEIGKFNVSLEPIKLSDAVKQFIPISISEIPSKWFIPIKKDMRGLLPLGSELNGLGKKVGKNRAKTAYVCPFCIRYFILPEQAFLHLRPGCCSEMKGYNIKLNADDAEKAEAELEDYELNR